MSGPLASGRPEGVYRIRSSMPDVANRTSSLLDQYDYNKGILTIRGLEAGPGIKLNVQDADNNVYTTGEKKIVISLDGQAGDVVGFSSLGTVGEEIIGSKEDGILSFKRIQGGSGIVVINQGDYLEITSTASGAGEVNVGSNIGTGTGLYSGKSGAVLQFRSLKGESGITITNSGDDVRLSFDASTLQVSDLGGTFPAGKITGLSSVAISGSYLDLLDLPLLFDGDYLSLTNRPVLFSGAWDDLTNPPYVPTFTDIQNTVGDMVTGNVETGITVEYDSIGKKLNFVVDPMALSSDPTPTLSGNLDTNGHKIIGDVIELAPTSGIVRLNGVEYIGRQTAIIRNNQISESLLYSTVATAYEATMMDYVILRDGNVRLGTLSVINNGVVTSLSDAGPEIGNIGVTFHSSIVGGNLEIRYTSTNTGADGEIAFMIRRWDGNA